MIETNSRPNWHRDNYRDNDCPNYNSLIPGPETTDTAILFDFVWLWESGLQNKAVNAGLQNETINWICKKKTWSGQLARESPRVRCNSMPLGAVLGLLCVK